MNGVKSGFTTLNRLLGKKNKESSLSKSSSNLSRSMSQLPTTGSSQPQNTYININSNNNNNVDNKILPLQSMSNAPFEQTFRITVQLPRDQLYVARLGAKTPLVVLLKMVCDDKQLDVNKYEFRHPGDMSQAYDNDCTIGFVGLNELKLVLKTEKYQNGNFNTEEILKLRNGGGINLASSNNNGSNNSTKTSLVSPYSSTNSLNSIDSSGMMSTSSRGGSIVGQHPPIPPSRKKRAAPRPPSQNSIPENKDININNNNSNYNNNNNNIKEFKSPLPPTIEDTMPIKKTFHVSSPNLVSNFSIATNHTNGTHVKDIYDDTTTNHDYNHNIKTNGEDNRYNSANDLRRIESTKSHQRPMSMQIPYQTSTSNRSSISSYTINLNEPSTIINHSRTSSESSEQNIRDGDKPEPIPRRRLFSGSKKKAPAPQPRGLPPVPTPRFLHESKEKLNTVELNQHNEIIKNNVNVKKDEVVAANVTSVKEKIIPAVAIDDERNQPIAQNGNISTNIDDKRKSLSLENKKLSINSNGDCKNVPLAEHRPVPTVAPVVKEPIVTNGKRQSFESDDYSLLNSGNVSKVMLNVEEKQRIEEPIIIKSNVDNKPLSNSSSRNSSISVNANAEPNQNSIETSSVISSDADDISMTESPKIKMESSDDDVDKDKMEIYNLKLGKSTTKTSTRDDSLAVNGLTSVETEDITPEVASIRSQSPLWTYTLPAPANFADPSDTSSIAVMDNSTIIRDDLSSVPDNLTIMSDSTIGSELIDEIIKPVIHDNHIVVESDEIIRNNSDIEDGYHGGDLEKSRKLSQESLKKNLHNETIENRKNHVIEELSNVINENTIEKLISTRHLSSHDDGILVNSSLTNFKMATYQSTPNEDIVEVKRSSITKSISRSDSFHTTRIEATVKTTELSLPRSSSQISLNETATARRKSSGSLHESPSLQSLEIMKMILPGLNSGNSSKRSSMNVNEDEAMLKSLSNKRSSISDEVVSSPLKRHSREDIKIEQKRESIKEDETPITTAKVIEEPNSVVEPEKVGIKQTSTTEEEDEGTNKKWKYQGPPAINFSSWAERPKVQVAIKSDRDYKFGGGGISNRVSDDSDPIVEHNNNRNQKEHKLPIVRSVEYKKPMVIPLNQDKEELKSSPPIVLRPKPEIVNKPNFYQTFSRPNTIHINGNYNNSTTNKFTPYVRGFKTENLNTNSNAVSIESIVNIPKKSKENVELANKNVNTNSTTTTKISNNNNISNGNNTLPFGQNTLRRTGLKEKILFTENPVATRPSSEMPSQQIHLKQQETVVKSTTIVNDTVVDNGNSHTNNISSTNNSVIKSNIRNDPAANIPPPPPVPKLAPVVRSAVIKKSNSVIDDDPRDQLLTAIKSFNRGTLKRS